ncbi:hypothetical protein [Saccharothrix luteola]|uniref:hypothetical protein n=1 Tax=Saccharothrix luteola TaxID=2893018 RepID=UPI001E2F608C|nr:hypothetical protein [Saccharothrix luteola]MCC8243368.1 hypothetical protein [Saccharothrix luteola]
MHGLRRPEPLPVALAGIAPRPGGLIRATRTGPKWTASTRRARRGRPVRTSARG